MDESILDPDDPVVGMLRLLTEEDELVEAHIGWKATFGDANIFGAERRTEAWDQFMNGLEKQTGRKFDVAQLDLAFDLAIGNPQVVSNPPGLREELRMVLLVTCGAFPGVDSALEDVMVAFNDWDIRSVENGDLAMYCEFLGCTKSPAAVMANILKRECSKKISSERIATAMDFVAEHWRRQRPEDPGGKQRATDEPASPPKRARRLAATDPEDYEGTGRRSPELAADVPASTATIAGASSLRRDPR